MNVSIKVIISLILMLGLSCSDAQMRDGNTEKESADHTATAEPLDKQSTNETDQSIADSDIPDEGSIASEPIMVGGVFLSCAYNGNLRCRLDTEDEQNVEPKADYVVRVVDQNSNELSFTTLDEGDDYRWLVDLMGSTASNEIRFQVDAGEETLEYVMYLELRVLAIGDGGDPQGCPAPSAGRAPIRTNTPYSKSIQLPSAGKLKISLNEVCDIVRENDTNIRVLDSNGDPIFLQYLAARRTTSPSFDVKIPAAGSYRIQLVSGDNIDIDDFRVSDMRAVFIPEGK